MTKFIGYKVVTVRKDQDTGEDAYFSSFVHLDKPYRLKYPVGEMVTYVIGTLGLFVFDLLYSAESFMSFNKFSKLVPMTILEVEYNHEEILPKPSRIPVNPSSIERLYREAGARRESQILWLRSIRRCETDFDLIPRGTILVPRLWVHGIPKI